CGVVAARLAAARGGLAVLRRGGAARALGDDGRAGRVRRRARRAGPPGPRRVRGVRQLPCAQPGRRGGGQRGQRGRDSREPRAARQGVRARERVGHARHRRLRERDERRAARRPQRRAAGRADREAQPRRRRRRPARPRRPRPRADGLHAAAGAGGARSGRGSGRARARGGPGRALRRGAAARLRRRRRALAVGAAHAGSGRARRDPRGARVARDQRRLGVGRRAAARAGRARRPAARAPRGPHRIPRLRAARRGAAEHPLRAQRTGRRPAARSHRRRVARDPQGPRRVPPLSDAAARRPGPRRGERPVAHHENLALGAVERGRSARGVAARRGADPRAVPRPRPVARDPARTGGPPDPRRRRRRPTRVPRAVGRLRGGARGRCGMTVKLRDLDAVLATLKDFQRDTVEYAFRRMYLDDPPARRFLIADEVGLGKTLVARGLIAKALHHLKREVERVDVVYVCSNGAIARQNINRLSVTEAEHTAIASRLTLLPAVVERLKSNRCNFISFTPGTTFDLKAKSGRVDERLVIYRILADAFPELERGLLGLLQGNVYWDRWVARARNYDQPLDPDLA